MNSSNDSLAMQRITRLVDENSFIEIGSLVTARSTDFNLAATDTPSDGVITGHGLIDGNLVFIYSQDASVLNGTIGEMHAKKIAAVYDMAMKMGAPVIGFIDCAGSCSIRCGSTDFSRIRQLRRWTGSGTGTF